MAACRIAERRIAVGAEQYYRDIGDAMNHWKIAPARL